LTTAADFKRWLPHRTRTLRAVLDAYSAGISAGVFKDSASAWVWAPAAEIIGDIEAAYYKLAVGSTAERFELFREEVIQNAADHRTI